MLTAHEGSSDAAFQVKIIFLVPVVIVIICATIVVIFKTINITIISSPSSSPTLIIMDDYEQELNKAQLKPFLMRIWGQVGGDMRI